MFYIVRENNEVITTYPVTSVLQAHDFMITVSFMKKVLQLPTLLLMYIESMYKDKTTKLYQIVFDLLVNIRKTLLPGNNHISAIQTYCNC